MAIVQFSLLQPVQINDFLNFLIIFLNFHLLFPNFSFLFLTIVLLFQTFSYYSKLKIYQVKKSWGQITTQESVM